jgi:hypothetical protein
MSGAGGSTTANSTLIRNERIKLFAGFCNAIAGTMVTVGIAAPVAAQIYGAAAAGAILPLALFGWLAGAAVFHGIGQWSLASLR